MDNIEKVIANIDYKTFLNIIYKIPSCIFFKDTQLKYVFCTKHWEQQNSDDIIGKTDIEIRKDKENALLAIEADKNIIKTGQGCSYTIKSNIEGSLSYLELIKEPIFDENNNVIGIVGLINDVTEKMLFEQKLKVINSTDELTQLYNRRAGVEIIEEILKKNEENNAFILADINKFKHINDIYGHQEGDNILKEFALAIKNSINPNDIAMRLGGDEFIILLTDVKDLEQLKKTLRLLSENIVKIEIDCIKISAAFGATMIKKGVDFDSLYAYTDNLMYQAKEADIPFIIE